MLRDAIGNEIRIGSLLFWGGTNVVVKVMAMSPEEMTVAAVVALPKSKGDTQLQQFFALVNPEETQKVLDAMASRQVEHADGTLEAVRQ